ncbi:MAG: hypothetical protein BWY31_01270 [Lentisphaerae bacterium ADurb.Bin242]|nr:MAG: hypothetical protein BWY31_01270 [Lentisphaerae bacterium ADurb.Bin242]
MSRRLTKYEYDELDRRVKGQYFDVKWDYSYDQYNRKTVPFMGRD